MFDIHTNSSLGLFITVLQTSFILFVAPRLPASAPQHRGLIIEASASMFAAAQRTRLAQALAPQRNVKILVALSSRHPISEPTMNASKIRHTMKLNNSAVITVLDSVPRKRWKVTAQRTRDAVSTMCWFGRLLLPNLRGNLYISWISTPPISQFCWRPMTLVVKASMSIVWRPLGYHNYKHCRIYNICQENDVSL